MSSVAVVTDSTADLPADLVRSRGVTVVPLTVTLEGKEYLDGVDITADEFYTRLQGANGPVATTSQPAPARFQEVYRQLLQDHDEVISLHISEKLSGTYAAAVQGAELAGAGDRVRVVDSAMVSMPLGLMVLAATEVAAGGSAGEVVERLGALRREVTVFFMVSTLEYLRRGGRIGAANALLGSVLQVKPVLTIRDGQVTPLERVRTRERALARVIDLVREQDRGQGLCAIVGHAAAEATAERIASEIEPGCDTLLVQPLGPVVGAHAGPGTVGVGCYPAELLPLGLKKVSAAAAR